MIKMKIKINQHKLDQVTDYTLITGHVLPVTDYRSRITGHAKWSGYLTTKVKHKLNCDPLVLLGMGVATSSVGRCYGVNNLMAMLIIWMDHIILDWI